MLLLNAVIRCKTGPSFSYYHVLYRVAVPKFFENLLLKPRMFYFLRYKTSLLKPNIYEIFLYCYCMKWVPEDPQKEILN